MLAALKSVDTPIIVSSGDGLITINEGVTKPLKKGNQGSPFISKANPDLVAEVMWERKRRHMLREINTRRFS